MTHSGSIVARGLEEAMWNNFRTDASCGMLAEVTTIQGHQGDVVHAYYARPMGQGPFPGIVLVHHLPGWDELYREFARRFADHGYATVLPDLYCRFGHGAPDDVRAAMSAGGGISDDAAVGDLAGAMHFLRSQPTSNGKIGIVGACSGGRHAFLTAARTPGFAAVGDLWGGRIVMPEEDLDEKRPVAPIDYTSGLSAPLLGLFGNEDKNPAPADVDALERELTRHGKEHEFHRYDGAGHGFFYYDRPLYRPEQAMDGWQKVFAFFARHLG